jgi:hypothetical protein
MEMKIKKVGLLVVSIMGLIVMGISSQALAGAGFEPPPPGAIYEGPEFWGTIVMKCFPGLNNDYVAVRFKKVVDCDVETEARFETGGLLECPADESEVLNQSLPEGTVVFGKSTPYITNVKNFEIEGDVVSFDAQFKYWHR